MVSVAPQPRRAARNFHMRFPVIGLTCCIAAFALAKSMPVSATRIDFADPMLRPTSEQQKAFVSAYLAAIASRRPEAVRELVHPASLACATSDASRDYLTLLHTRDASRIIPRDARIVVMPFDKSAFPYFWTTLAALPIEPSDILGIDVTHEERSTNGVLMNSGGSTIIRLLAPHEGRLHLLEHCLTTEGEDLFRAKRSVAPTETRLAPPKP